MNAKITNVLNMEFYLQTWFKYLSPYKVGTLLTFKKNNKQKTPKNSTKHFCRLSVIISEISKRIVTGIKSEREISKPEELIDLPDLCQQKSFTLLFNGAKTKNGFKRKQLTEKLSNTTCVYWR